MHIPLLENKKALSPWYPPLFKKLDKKNTPIAYVSCGTRRCSLPGSPTEVESESSIHIYRPVKVPSKKSVTNSNNF